MVPVIFVAKKPGNMNRFMITIGLAALSLTAGAQQENETKTLEEVVVEGAKVVHRPDGLSVYPTAAQKETSKNGYGILSKLALPQITVDEVQHKVMAPPNMGAVLVRINDLPASSNDLLSLDTKLVQSVEFIRNPGVRYGDDAGFVINFIVRRADSGWMLGGGLGQTLTTANGSGNFFAGYNLGKHGWSLSYNGNCQDLKGYRHDEEATYHDGKPASLSAGPVSHVTHVTRKDIGNRYRTFSHGLTLKYNFVEADKYVFQAVLSGDFMRVPRDEAQRQVVVDGIVHDEVTDSNDRNFSPALDLYFHRKLGDDRFFSVNVVGTYADSRYGYLRVDPAVFAYSTKGKMYDMISEVLFEKVWKPVTWSSGAQYRQCYTANVYEGSIAATSAFRNSDMKAFSRLKGIWGRLNYVVEAGIGRLYYRQADHRFDYWLFRPKLSLGYRLTNGLHAAYELNTLQKPPRPEKMVDTEMRLNEMEIRVGNPGLRPGRRTEHTFTLSCRSPRFYTEIRTLYRINAATNMPHIELREQADGRTNYVFGERNQGDINLLNISGYAQCTIIPEKLTATFSGGMARCFNYGDDYKHHYSAWHWRTTVTARLGKFSLMAYVDNGWRWLEGETKGQNGNACYLSASYRKGNLQVGLYWQHCFESRPLLNRAELLNEYVRKVTTVRNGSYGNMVTLNVSWRLSKGKEAKEVEKTLNNNGGESGVMKQKNM